MILDPKLKTFVFDELSQRLSPQLHFHSVAHTRDDVLPAVESLAKQMDVTGEDLLLLRTAALFHDVGYLERYENNEPLAVCRVRDVLPAYNYKPGQIETISGIIMKTVMPQQPENLLEKIMCDADMDSLGRKDYWALCQKLCEELAFFRQRIEPRDWLRQQLVFLESHNYFTSAAQQTRNAGKLENIQRLRTMIACDSNL